MQQSTLAIKLTLPAWLRPVDAPAPDLAIPSAPREPDTTHADLIEIRRTISALTVVTAAQNERINGQAAEIAASRDQIRLLQTVEAQLRGDLREAYTRITALESMLTEERTARTLQAEELGDMKRQLRDADSRLQKQRTDLTDQGKQIAVLEEERALARNVAQVWQLRAERYAARLVALGEPVDS